MDVLFRGFTSWLVWFVTAVSVNENFGFTKVNEGYGNKRLAIIAAEAMLAIGPAAFRLAALLYFFGVKHYIIRFDVSVKHPY